MNIKGLLLSAALTAFATPALAQLNVYEDYTVSDSVWSITTIKVDSNMGDYYLEGIKSTWVESNDVAKSLGHIEDYSIMVSAMPTVDTSTSSSASNMRAWQISAHPGKNMMHSWRPGAKPMRIVHARRRKHIPNSARLRVNT